MRVSECPVTVKNANLILGTVWKGAEIRSESIIRSLFKSWYNRALWFGAIDSKKLEMKLGPKEGGCVTRGLEGLTYEELNLLPT